MMIAQALAVQGIDSRMLFEKARIPYQSTVDPGSRIENSKITILFQLAITENQNPDFGLTVINYFMPAIFMPWVIHCLPAIACMKSASALCVSSAY